MKFKDIYAKWLATELIKKGHELHKVIPNPKRPNFTIFVFVVNDELNGDITKITEEKRNLQKLAF